MVYLDAQGEPAAKFIFQAGSTLTTCAGSNIQLLNGANQKTSSGFSALLSPWVLTVSWWATCSPD